MATLIWINIWIGIALVASLLAMGAIDYFINGETMEEVISKMYDFIVGYEELD